MIPVGLRRAAATRFLWWLRNLRGSPDALSRGFAVGTLVAFTPTVGVQMVGDPSFASSSPDAVIPFAWDPALDVAGLTALSERLVAAWTKPSQVTGYRSRIAK